MASTTLPPPILRPRVAAPAHSPGLSSAEAARRLAQVGRNALEEHEREPAWLKFGRNLWNLFALLLWVGGALAWGGGMPELSAAIVAVILLNAVFAYIQEHRAERAVEALRQILPARARVRRDGRPTEILAEALVPGDVLLLEAGDRISGDGRLLADVELRVDLSTLTGESRPVRRHAVRGGHGSSGIEAVDLVFAGTYVSAGSGEAEVTATGMRTEFGRIASLTQRAPHRPSPLEAQLDGVTRLVAAVSIGIGAVFFVVAGVLGMGLTDRFLFTIGVIVANLPSGLLPTVTLSLAIATQRMARRTAVVRRLSSVETLGCTTVICTDKTGTLTANQMTVRRLWLPSGGVAVEGTGYAPQGALVADDGVDRAALRELVRAAALCNDATLQEREGWRVVGDPTEGALLTLAHKAGIDPVVEAHRFPRQAEIPFDSARKRMSTLHATRDGRTAYVKGAPDVIVARSALSPAERARALAAADALGRESLRVLALARRLDAPHSTDAEVVERGLELLGIVGMHDPPRPEVTDAIARCRAAGIRVLMVTGDHGVTAEAIAQRIGLIDGPARILDGTHIDALDDEPLVAALGEPGTLVARVNPDQKLRIADVLHRNGEVVAMTGDGVNDAPALRAADIGVAMGRGGTDVAREAADIVLLDDNFASIAAAVEEGRAVYDNIRRFVQYHFASNVAELMAFLAWGLSLGAIPLPLVVMQVLAIDLGTDIVPAIALGAERAEPGVMERPPRPRRERLLNRRVLARVYGWVGLLEGLAGLGCFLAAYMLHDWRPFAALADEGDVYVQATAMTLAGIVAGQVGAALAFRTTRRSVFSIGLFSNRFLLAGIAFELALLVSVLYVPPLQAVFHMRAIEPEAWLLLAVIPPFVLGAEELRKAVFRRWVWR